MTTSGFISAGGAERKQTVRSKLRRGLTVVYVAVASTALVGFVSLGVDYGRVQLAKSELETAADAAGRAACANLASGTTTAQNAAVAAAAANTCDGTSVVLTAANDLTWGVWDPNAKIFTPTATNPNAVKIQLKRTAANGNPINLTFARAIGRNSCNVTSTTVHCLTSNTGAFSIIGINSITISGGGFTDSYNSGSGAYGGANKLHKGAIASNGNILLKNTAKVDGDARCGVGKTTTLQNTATVTGVNAPMGTTLSYPSVTLPASYSNMGTVNISSGTTSLPGGTYVFDSFTMSGGTVNWTGPVNLYFKTGYTISGTAVINTYNNIPANRNLYFMSTCATASWTGSHSCVGEMYAPDTAFTVGGSAQLYGRITAKSINLSTSGGLHYDEALNPIGVKSSRDGISRVQ